MKSKKKIPKFKYDDAGRWKSGFSNQSKDCVTRAISIYKGFDYLSAYELVNKLINELEIKKVSGATLGVSNNTTKKLFRKLGLKWVKSNKIPNGKKKYILNMPNHVCVIENGTVLDTHNYFEQTKRVYGYWK